MQVSVEKTSELNRKMTVSLPEEMVQEKMEERFKSLARSVKIDGFRPGKVPVRVVKKMYKDRVRGEVTGDLIQSTYFQALQDQKLTPAGQPHINSIDESAGFEYVAEFEVYPEILVDSLSDIEIKRPVSVVEQSDQDAMIEKLREQKKEWNEVERVSQQDDRATINFSGVCNGENFTDGQVDNYPVVIGAKQMIPGFEEELIGLEKGQSKTFEIQFPEEYGNEKLAGNKAEFSIEVVSIEEPALPEVNEEFIKAYGVEDGLLESFQSDVKTNLERELDQAIKRKMKDSVMDALYENVNVTVPKVLVDQEIENMKKPYAENARAQNKNINDIDMPNDLFEEQAKRRVALGLILGEIIQKNEIKIDEDRVRSTIEDMAKSYEKPDEVLSWYYAEEGRLNEVRQMVLEEQTVDWILGQAKITDENLGFSQLMEQ